MNHRRRFLGRLTAATATIATAPCMLAAGAFSHSACAAPSRPSAAHFEARLGRWHWFQDPTSGRRRRLLLVGVHPGPSVPHLDQFSLIFRTDAGCPPATGTYWVSDTAGDGFALFAQTELAQSVGTTCRAELCLLGSS